MLPINAFIKVAFLFFKIGLEIWLKSQVSKKSCPWNWGMDFLFALIAFSIDFLVALNTIALVYFLL